MRLAALVFIVGIVLLPLRAVAATLPTMIAYDVAVRSTATTTLEKRDAVQPEAESARTVCDDATFAYYDSSNRPTAAGIRGIVPYDDAPNFGERREVGVGVIYVARAATAAAEGVALAEGESAAAGMQAHHNFPQQMAEQFDKAGINIEEFHVQLSEGTHLGQLHSSGGIPGSALVGCGTRRGVSTLLPKPQQDARSRLEDCSDRRGRCSAISTCRITRRFVGRCRGRSSWDTN
jgi:hypothetical protein